MDATCIVWNIHSNEAGFPTNSCYIKVGLSVDVKQEIPQHLPLHRQLLIQIYLSFDTGYHTAQSLQ